MHDWTVSLLLLPSLVLGSPSYSSHLPTILLLTTHTVLAYDHVDSRCSCKCPEAVFIDPDIKTDWQARKMYINSTVAAADCDCEHVVVPVLNLTKEQIDKFCPRCLCSHETRSVLTIKVAVGIILWVLSLLFLYLVYLLCIEPLLGGKGVVLGPVSRKLDLNTLVEMKSLSTEVHSDILADFWNYYSRGRTSAPYRRQDNEAEIDDNSPVTPDDTPMAQYSGRGGARSVVNRLGVNQERWKRQVEIQRSSVYDRHTLLN